MAEPRDLQEIKERVERATEGSWEVELQDDGITAGVTLILHLGDHDGGGWEPQHRIEYEVPSEEESPSQFAEAVANADFIARAIEDVPYLLERLQSLEAERSWQPIETAPKDGKRVILFAPPVRFPHIAIASWEVNYNSDAAVQPRHWGGWPFLVPPTHWMPLPNGPALTSTPASPSIPSHLIDDEECEQCGRRLAVCECPASPSTETQE